MHNGDQINSQHGGVRLLTENLAMNRAPNTPVWYTNGKWDNNTAVRVGDSKHDYSATSLVILDASLRHSYYKRHYFYAQSTPH